MKISWLFIIVLLASVAIFSVQNAEPISVRFLIWQFSNSAALVIQLAALLGAIVGLIVGAMSRRSAKRPRPEEPPPPRPAPSPDRTEGDNRPGIH